MAQQPNGKPVEQQQEGEGIIEVPILWQRVGPGQFNVKVQTVRFANVQGGWEAVIDMLIDAVKISRREAREAAARRIMVAQQMPPQRMQ